MFRHGNKLYSMRVRVPGTRVDQVKADELVDQVKAPTSSSGQRNARKEKRP